MAIFRIFRIDKGGRKGVRRVFIGNLVPTILLPFFPFKKVSDNGSSVHNSHNENGINFDHDFNYSFPLFSSLLKKERIRKGEWIENIVIKSHLFLLDLFEGIRFTDSLDSFIFMILKKYIFFYPRTLRGIVAQNLKYWKLILDLFLLRHFLENKLFVAVACAMKLSTDRGQSSI